MLVLGDSEVSPVQVFSLPSKRPQSHHQPRPSFAATTQAALQPPSDCPVAFEQQTWSRELDMIEDMEDDFQSHEPRGRFSSHGNHGTASLSAGWRAPSSTQHLQTAPLGVNGRPLRRVSDVPEAPVSHSIQSF